MEFDTSPQSSPRSRWRGRSVRAFRGYEFGPRGAPPSEIRVKTFRLPDFLHLNFRRVIHAELEQGGVGVKCEVGFEFRRFKCAAFAFEFLDGQCVERNWVAAEPELIQHQRIMQQRAIAAFVLADERVGDVQNDTVAERGQGVNFRHGGGESSGVVLKTLRVVHAAQRKAVKMSADTGGFLVQQRRDADDFCDLPADEF